MTAYTQIDLSEKSGLGLHFLGGIRTREINFSFGVGNQLFRESEREHGGIKFPTSLHKDVYDV